MLACRIERNLGVPDVLQSRAHLAHKGGCDAREGHAEARQRHGEGETIGGHAVLIDQYEGTADPHPPAAC